MSLESTNQLIFLCLFQMDNFAYADKTREKQRLEILAKRKAEKQLEVEAATTTNSSANATPASKKKKMRGTIASETAWSQQKAKKERKEERREKKVAKRAFVKKQQKQMEEKQGQNEKNLATSLQDEPDEDDWAQDEREAKRARKEKTNAETLSNSRFDGL